MVATQAAMQSISPFFIVRNLQETIDFYRDCLGFETTFLGPEPDPYFAIINRDRVQIFIKEIDKDIEPVPNRQRHQWARWDAYVYTQDPDGLASDINARGGEKKVVPEDTSDGLRGFEIVDPNGYVFFFGRPRE
jgi:catechol 2,3-dioxygenase-like lactoylglutathione lyase family enzyme